MNKLEFNEELHNSELEFDAVEHEYKCNGKKLISVTQVINRYTEDFNADKVIDKMFEKSVSDELYIGPKREIIGMTKQQIKDQWECNRIAKSAYGTFIHNEAEDIGNGKDKGIKIPELNQVRKFFKTEGFEIVEQELQLYSEELGIAGTVDLLLKKDDKLYIYDFKTNINKDLSQREPQFNKYLKEPISNIPATEYWKYSLQMSIYRYLFTFEPRYRKYGDYEFGESAILHLIGNINDLKDKFGRRTIYPEMKRCNYKIINTPYMKMETESIIKDLNKKR